MPIFAGTMHRVDCKSLICPQPTTVGSLVYKFQFFDGRLLSSCFSVALTSISCPSPVPISLEAGRCSPDSQRSGSG